MPADVEALVELGLQASVIESPMSDLKLRALGVSRESMLDRIGDAVALRGGAGHHGRLLRRRRHAAPTSTFLRQAYETAIEAGAKEIVVVDTIGVATPEAVAELVGRTREWLGPDVPVHFHGHNDFGLATAAAVAAVRAGARWIHGTINGMGERGRQRQPGRGGAHAATRCTASPRTFGSNGPARSRPRRRARPARRSTPGSRPSARRSSARESGAVASQFHDPEAIEPYSSELVGAERRIVLGKKSGLDSIRIKVDQLGLDVPEEQWPDLLAAGQGTRRREARPRHRRGAPKLSFDCPID